MRLLKQWVIIFFVLLLTACGNNGNGNGNSDGKGKAPTTRAPTASDVIIIDDNGGDAKVGDSLTGGYIYADVDDDAEGISIFRWLRNNTPINDATDLFYTLVIEDNGQSITFEVTPIAVTGSKTGNAVTSPEVTVINTLPVADAGINQSLRFGAGDIRLDGSNSSDADGDTLTYLWEITDAPENSSAALASTNGEISSFTPDMYGIYQLQLTVGDGLDSVSDSVKISILNNTQPLANAGENQRYILGFGAGSVFIDGSASSDPENDTLSYLWEIIQSPDGSMVSLVTNTDETTAFAPDVTGTYRVQLTVSDGLLAHAVVVDIDVANNTLPTANAGDDMDVDRNSWVGLSGDASTDPDNQGLSYSWTQIINQCPDVTGGSGKLTGVSPRFQAPAEVCTLIFDLRVNDGMGDSMADRVYIQVMEDRNNALFVDLANGNNSNLGTRDLPLATINMAISNAAQLVNSPDVYVMEGEYNRNISLPKGVSLYGGYGPGWERDRDRYISRVGTVEVIGNVSYSITIDGFTIIGPASFNASSYGVILTGSSLVSLSNNIITSFGGSSGSSGGVGIQGVAGEDGEDGSDGDCDSRFAYWIPAPGGSGAYDGGWGGSGEYSTKDGTNGINGNGPGGGNGGTGGAAGNPGLAGGSGVAGRNGTAGNNGARAAQIGTFMPGYYLSSKGGDGLLGTGGSGGGGGGGGGGQFGAFVLDGTGNYGGGGGGGGYPGSGGTGGLSGQGAFGVYLYEVTDIVIVNNTITTVRGGRGGDGGLGGTGGAAGNGGIGASVCTSEVGRGGNGGRGGFGGNGGNGGSGSGGPSIGIASPAGISSITINNTNIYNIATPSSGGSASGITGYSGISAEVYLY